MSEENTYTYEFLSAMSDSILSEVQLASESKDSSLRYLKNPILANKKLTDYTAPEFLVVGGSILQYGPITEGSNYDDFEEVEFQKLTCKQDFLELVSTAISPTADVLCINFSFPSEPLVRDDKLDMKFLQATKGHQLDDLLGENIGEEIEKHLLKTRNQKIDVNLAHDLTCLIANIYGQSDPDFIIGGVVGTGFNFGFIENGEVINLECACFDKFEATAEGKELDSSSIAPGESMLEKHISGNYLYQHYNIWAKEVGYPKLESTKDLYEIISFGSDQEVQKAKRLFEQSAAFTACNIKAIIDYKLQGKEREELQEFSLVMEGSIYKRNKYFRSYLSSYLEMLNEDDYFSVRFITKNKSQIKGAIATVFESK